jgi:predicted metal-dependent hydrolase
MPSSAAVAIPPRDITTRRVSFDYPSGELPRHFVGGDLVMSHVVAMLSAMFPNGEDFFVESVRNYRDQVTDPELKRQVARFIGQEAIHGREHRTFNDRLAQLGFTTRLVDRVVDVGLRRFLARVLPRRTQLAITAALEHYTATLAEVLLSEPRAREMLDVDEVRYLLLWHAVEESEHKSVAFDVYQSVCGIHFVRARVMDAVTVVFVVGLVLATARSLLSDRAAWNPVRLGRSLGRLRHSPFLRPAVIHRLREYNRRDFHPDDHDASAWLDHWRAELFGPDGVLADRLPGSGPAPAPAG